MINHIESRTGLKFKKEGKSVYQKCPFCFSQKGFRVNLELPKSFKCFGDGCEAKGTIIDFEMRFQTCKEKEAIEWLSKQYNLKPQSEQSDLGKKNIPATETSTYSNSKFAKKIWEQAKPVSLDQAKEILKARGFGNLAYGRAANKLANIARLNEYKSEKWIIVPYCAGETGEVTGIHRILLSDLKTKKDLGDKRGLTLSENNSKPCIIVESLANGLALYALGYNVIITGGAENKKAIVDKIEKLKSTNIQVLIWLDRGAEESQQRYCDEFFIKGIWFEKYRNKGFDVNDLIKENVDDFSKRVQEYVSKATQNCPLNITTRTDKQESIDIEKRQEEPLEWIEVTERGKLKVIPGIAADCYFKKQNGNLIYAYQSFWRYEAGVWREAEEKQIKAEIQMMIGRELSKMFLVEDIVFQISNFALQPREFEFDQNPWLLNFTNGVLDIKNGVFSEHKKEYYQTLQFSFPYDRKQKCVKWEMYLKSLEFAEDTNLRLQEWSGYCLVPITPLQKCLFLKGEGDNGKSVFLETLAAMLKNVSAIEVHHLFEKFKVGELRGKLANICTDIQTNKIFSEEFKKIVSGEAVTAEKKFKNPFQFRPFAKILFSANNFIPTKDRSHGFYRRFDILEFKKIFAKHEQDGFLKDKLKAELAGIFNWAYEGLQRLIRNNWKMTDSKEMQQTMDEFKEASNPVHQFINECCEANPTGSIETKTFRREYENWCRDMGYEVLSDNKLGVEIKRLGFDKKRKREHGKFVCFYHGINIRR